MERTMIKLSEVYKHYGVDHMYDDEFTSIEYYRLKQDGDIQIWDVMKNGKIVWEVFCNKTRRSHSYHRLADAMMAGVFWYLYQNKYQYVTS